MNFALPKKLPAQPVLKLHQARSDDDKDKGKEKEKQQEKEQEQEEEQEIEKQPRDMPEAKIPELAYEKPSWSAFPQEQCYVEVLKQGAIIERVALGMDREFVVCGRLPSCDLSMEHASVSRHHAVLQFAKDGRVLLYDLGSSHGTLVNKTRAPARHYVPLDNGSVIRFGESTRLYVLQRSGGASEDEGEEEGEERKEQTALSEGLANIADPIKTLREWFEENGARLTFERIPAAEEGLVKLRVALPSAALSAPSASPREEDVCVEGSGATRRDTEVAVCRLACAELLRLGELAQNSTEDNWRQWKRQREEEQEDERDVYFDRTGTQKTRNDGSAGQVETRETLSVQRAAIEARLGELRAAIERCRSFGGSVGGDQCADAGADEVDELDAYMANVSETRNQEELDAAQGEMVLLQKDLVRVDAILATLGPAELRLPMQSSPAPKALSVPSPPPKLEHSHNHNDKKNEQQHDQQYDQQEGEECEEYDTEETARLKAKYGY